MQSRILLVKKERTAWLTFNRPEALNALDEDMVKEFLCALKNAEEDDSVDVVIITGKGKAFSAGRDIRRVLEGTEWSGEHMCRALEQHPKPVIAAVNGYCFTGSLELIMSADLVIAAENAMLGDTHALFGLVPGSGQTQRLPRQIGARKAKELMFTCENISAREAERLGMVNRVVPPDRMEEEVMETARRISRCEQPAIREIKRLVNEGMRMSLAEGLELEAKLHEGIPIHPSAEGRKKMEALLKKRQD